MTLHEMNAMGRAVMARALKQPHRDRAMRRYETRRWVQEFMRRRRWTLCRPGGDWPYWHILNMNTGGITPTSPEQIILEAWVFRHYFRANRLHKHACYQFAF